MRHDKAVVFIELARLLASRAEGVSLDEMARHAACGRRTAERLRDALALAFPQLEILQDGGAKRFRIPGGLDGFLQTPTREELVELETASASLRRSGQPLRADTLDRLNAKIRSAVRAASLRRLGPDVEALARAEASLARVGPRPVEDPAILSAIREALMAMKALEFTYQGGSRPGAPRQVCPYGLLFERTNYLIGADLGRSESRTWRLDRIQQIRVLDTPACAPAEFDLEAFAARSFGIYQDEVEDVVLRLRAPGAQEARRWRFHPSQTLEDQPDGSLLVRFRSSGMLELAWHLFTWGETVEILAPPRLKATMRRALQTAFAAHTAQGVASPSPGEIDPPRDGAGAREP